MPLHSSLGNRARLHVKKKRRKKNKNFYFIKVIYADTFRNSNNIERLKRKAEVSCPNLLRFQFNSSYFAFNFRKLPNVPMHSHGSHRIAHPRTYSSISSLVLLSQKNREEPSTKVPKYRALVNTNRLRARVGTGGK